MCRHYDRATRGAVDVQSTATGGAGLCNETSFGKENWSPDRSRDWAGTGQELHTVSSAMRMSVRPQGGRIGADERGCRRIFPKDGFGRAATVHSSGSRDLGIRPGTSCVYDVEADGVADLTDPVTLRVVGVELADLARPWKQIALVEKKRPPTWDLADRVIAGGCPGGAGTVRPRARVNLVIWRWNVGPASPRVVPLDPLADLPRDQSSWSTS